MYTVDSSHENCSYHIHKYSCKFNGIQRTLIFLHESSGGIWGGGGGRGSTYIRGRLVFGKTRYIFVIILLLRSVLYCCATSVLAIICCFYFMYFKNILHVLKKYDFMAYSGSA